MTDEEVIEAIFVLAKRIRGSGNIHVSCLLLAVCYAAFDPKKTEDLYEHVDDWMMKNSPYHLDSKENL